MMNVLNLDLSFFHFH